MKYLIVVLTFMMSVGLLAKEDNGDELVHFKMFLYEHDESKKEFTIAAELTMEKHWHTYWINPGDAGLPTNIEWTIPENVKLKDQAWPYPEKIPFADMANFGYESVVAAFYTFSYSGNVDFSKISAEALWLVCKEKCLPGSGKATLNTKTTQAKKKELAMFENMLPLRANVDNDLIINEESVKITLDLPKLNKVKIFPVTEGIFENAKDPDIQMDADGFSFVISLSDFRIAEPNEFELLIISPDLISKYGKESIIVKVSNQ